MNKRLLVFLSIVVFALIVYAFSQGFLNGIHLLGDILNIFGMIFVSMLNLIWNIPVIGQKIIKNCITTIIIVIIFGTSLSNAENKAASFIIGGGVSLVCAFLAWCNLI